MCYLNIVLKARVKDQEVYLSVEDLTAFIQADSSERVWVNDNSQQFSVCKRDLTEIQILG